MALPSPRVTKDKGLDVVHILTHPFGPCIFDVSPSVVRFGNV